MKKNKMKLNLMMKMCYVLISLKKKNHDHTEYVCVNYYT